MLIGWSCTITQFYYQEILTWFELAAKIQLLLWLLKKTYADNGKDLQYIIATCFPHFM